MSAPHVNLNRSRPGLLVIKVSGAEEPAIKNRFQDISDRFSLLGWFALKILISIGVVALLVYFAYLLWRPPTYTLAPIQISKELEKLGFTGNSARDLLIFKINDIQLKANSIEKRVKTLDTVPPKIDFQIPRTSFSFQSLVSWAREVIGAGDVLVTTNLIMTKNEFELFAQIHDQRYANLVVGVMTKANSLDDAATNEALNIMSQLDPVVTGLYRMQQTMDQCNTHVDPCTIEQFATALTDLNRSLSSGAKDIQYRALITLANLHGYTGDFTAASRYASQAVALDRKRVEGFEVLGVQQIALHEHSSAMSNFNAAIAINKNEPFAYQDIAADLSAQERYAAAIPQYRKSLELWGGNVEAIHDLGYAFYRNDQYSEAIASYRRAIALESARPSWHNDLANAIRELLSKSRKMAAAGCAASGDYPQYSDAIREHLTAIRSPANNQQWRSYIHHDLAWTYRACGDGEKADAEDFLAEIEGMTK